MEYEKFNEPYEIVRGTEGGKLREITIRAVGEGTELSYEELREATKQILDHYRKTSLLRGHVRTTEGGIYPKGGRIDRMVIAYENGNGKVTDEYLARLSAAYAHIAPNGRGVSMTLSKCLGKPVQTVKGHIMRARHEGFLSEAEEGKEGGEITEKTKKLLEQLDKQREANQT